MPPPPDDSRVQVWTARGLLLGLGAWLAARTWRAWADPLIDFGRELYVPWRLAEGDALYRDVAWFNGPLSAWCNALVFRVAGAGLDRLVAVNLMLLALVVLGLERLLRRVSSLLATAVALGLFLVLLAFGQIGGVGNYNWVTPYSHELTHGFALSVAALLVALRCADRPTARGLSLGGALLGLVAATKVEVLIAAAGACAVPFGVTLARARGRRGRCLGALLAGLSVTISATYLLLAARLGASGAAEALGAPFAAALDLRVRSLPFYRVGAGLDDPRASLWTLGRSALAALTLFGPAFALGAALPRLGRSGPRRMLALTTALVLGYVAWTSASGPEVEWLRAARFLPLVPLVVALEAGWRLARKREREVRRRALARLALALFALLLLAKMILYARIAHYGFVLAVPALLLLCSAVLDWLPAALERRGRAGDLARAGSLGVLLALALVQDSHARQQRAAKIHELGSGADAMRTAGRGYYAAEALADLEQRLAPGEPFLVLPEGVMLNYLARRPTPTRYVNFMPPELLLFGEETVQAALEAAAPRVVLLVHKDTSEYGARSFGSDYAPGIGQWLTREYRIERVLRALPFGSEGFGIAILERLPH